MTASSASVVVRCRNEAPVVADALRSIRAQTVEAEVILVDSGSTDGTVEIARQYCDQVIPLAPEEFTYGRALNVGAARAAGSVLFALSAHCVATDDRWIERSLAHYDDPRVAATFGAARSPGGDDLWQPRAVTFEDVALDPHWGYSNHGGSWCRRAWEEIPFDETLPACEDKQWMWRVMLAGWSIVADARLVVATPHRRAAGLPALWRREVAEHQPVAELLNYPVPSLADLAVEWWSAFPWVSRYPRWLRRLGPWRNVELIAGFVGDRRGAALRGPHTLRIPAGGCARWSAGPVRAHGLTPADQLDFRSRRKTTTARNQRKGA